MKLGDLSKALMFGLTLSLPALFLNYLWFPGFVVVNIMFTIAHNVAAYFLGFVANILVFTLLGWLVLRLWSRKVA
jgi:hypothetical protein